MMRRSFVHVVGVTFFMLWSSWNTAHAASEPTIDSGIASMDRAFRDYVVRPIESVFFYDVIFWDNDAPAGKNARMPLIVIWLMLGATFFTLRYRFINLRGFSHALAVLRGKYDNDEDEGEVSHFQALSSALSATVGLGNIGGVAVAISVGGPGAAFWMVLAGFLGMSSKFTECSLGQMYRRVDANGTLSGGPMHYLKEGLADLNRPGMTLLGKVLAWFFALLCIGASLGAGCMYQANQSHAQLAEMLPLEPMR